MGGFVPRFSALLLECRKLSMRIFERSQASRCVSALQASVLTNALTHRGHQEPGDQAPRRGHDFRRKLRPARSVVLELQIHSRMTSRSL